ncbi:cellulose binding domain-containing protein [Actinomadura livida]|uniref:CBM2 domain-containing protein n=1 Tax=Actinomadura livida TaxID=79909 RepID=A0A7W7N0I3_9ACTN|nr:MULTISPECIES: cellulose binding domain-containing protein [Actinomadura]MBB4776960.1 hypothetical protein [Actinomadura catellatispora]
MSGEEPGYVPPDHKTTAEFRVRGRAAESETAAAGPEATFVDRPVDDLVGSGATLQDVPQDDSEDDLDVTFQDSLIPGLDDEAPATPTDGPGTLDTVTDGPESSNTVTDVPLPSVRSAPEAAVFAMPAPAYAQAPPPPEPAPEPAVEEEPAALEEQAPAGAEPAAPPDGAGGPVPEEGPWTGQFAAESEMPAPAAPSPAPPSPAPSSPAPPNPAEPSPAFAYAMPGAPPQETMPPAASPSGAVPPSGTPRSKGPLLLVALAGGLVVLLAVAGVAVLLLTGGSGKDDKAGAGTSPAASAPPAEGGGPAPATPGGPSPSGAPATPPVGGAPGEQPASPVVPTAPIGPVLRGTGITYQLVQQDEGYFEGRMVITNRTDEPMKTWKLTFRTPGADVKNIWGAKLAKGGEKVEIKNLDDAPAIPPGGTWEVQFGAAGATTTPKGCKLNGRACGF